MHRKYCCFLILVLVLGSAELPRAQEASTVNQPSEKLPPRAEEKPIAQRTSSSLVPLDILQIRANLPGAPAEKFEYLRRHRKITLDALGEVSAKKTNLATLLNVQETTKKAFEEEDKEQQERSTFPSKERLKDDLVRFEQKAKETKKTLETAKAKKPSPPSQEIRQLEFDLSHLEREAKRILEALDNYDQRLKDEEKKKQEFVAKFKQATEAVSRTSEQIEKASQDQLSYQRLLGEIDDMVNQLFIASDATNSFKLKMSLAFSILVGVVIVGFFIIAWSNEEIKKTIFSNESGIQFITMFAIVIAVILFGIIGVLESKELSALLGGLSGYILGKSRA